ncbi:hypothetical protein [Parvibaculum sp.]|uniref:hypothetical protein n=1 Tax=Parvibaculum sp. TaxID=2024848 RepID=UPI002637ABC1|nr:hypothetical protein [Parvibaculum sp.]MCW5728153.1 hypothetical protein [Parvibaculum sp.]
MSVVFFPTCQDVTVTVPPGEERVAACDAEVVAIMASSADFLLAFDDGGFQFAEAGMTYMGRRKPDGARPRARKLRFKNEGGAPLIVQAQLSTGEIIDNRIVFGGVAIPVQPIDFNGPQPISISSALMPPSPMLTDHGGSIPSVGASDAILTTGSTNFVDSASNVNGVILRRGTIGGSGGTDQAHILVGNRRVLSFFGPNTRHIGELYIRPGTRLRGEILTTGRIEVSFDIL